MKDSKGKLWIGTRNGLFVEGRDNQFSYFSTQSNPALSNNRIRNIYQNSDSTYLIGTSSGLNIFNDNKNTIEYLGIEDGLNSDVIYSLEIDDEDDLWVTTGKGISLIDKDKKISNFQDKNELKENSFFANASMKTESGDIYFGGKSGITKFNPTKVKAINNVETPFITKLEVLKRDDEPGFELDYPLTDNYELTHRQCNFIISFSSINYTNPDNLSLIHISEPTRPY